MKKIMALLFLAGFLAGALAVLTALEWTATQPWSAHLSWLSSSTPLPAKLKPSVRLSSRPLCIQTARPSIRLRVSRVLLHASLVPMDLEATNSPQQLSPSINTAQGQTSIEETNATWATKIRTLAKLPDSPPRTKANSAQTGTQKKPQIQHNNADKASSRSASNKPKAASSAKSKPATLPGPDQLYAQALKLYQTGHYVLARKEFERFGRAYPRHRLQPNVLYWSGETWYAQQHFSQAQEKFIQVTTRYPRHAKSPDALLKQAYCVLRLGNAAQAQHLLHSLQTRYPKSEATILGQRVLRSLQDHSAASIKGAVHG